MSRGIPKLVDAIGRGHAPVCNWSESHPITGKTWRDMPGPDIETQKIEFFLYRRGLRVENKKGAHIFHLSPQMLAADRQSAARAAS